MKLLDAIFGKLLPPAHQDDPRLGELAKRLNYQFARGNVLLQQGRVITKAEVRERLRGLHNKLLQR